MAGGSIRTDNCSQGSATVVAVIGLEARSAIAESGWSAAYRAERARKPRTRRYWRRHASSPSLRRTRKTLPTLPENWTDALPVNLLGQWLMILLFRGYSTIRQQAMCMFGTDLLKLSSCQTRQKLQDQICYVTQSQQTDTALTSPNSDPLTPGRVATSVSIFFFHSAE